MNKEIKKIKELIENEDKLLKTIEEKEIVFQKFAGIELFKIAFGIIEKINHLKKSILKDQTNLLLNNAILRYILEALIQVELLKKEEKYRYVSFYSIFNHQINKLEKLLERLKKEIELIEHFEKLENEDINKKTSNFDISDFQKFMRQIEEQGKEFDKIVHKEITLFFGDFEKIGFAIQKDFMINNLQKKMDDKLTELKQLKIDKAKELVKDKNISKYFDFRNQHSRVFKEMKDSRSWEKKAKEVGLEAEYKLMYDITSSLLHCTSYSILTSNSLIGDENVLILSLIYQYSKRIYDRIKELINYEFVDGFLIVEN